MKKRLCSKTVGPLWARWLLFAGCALGMGYAIAKAVLWINFSDLLVVQEWAAKYPAYIPLTALFYGLLVFVVGAAVGRLWLSTLLVSSGALALALVDYFKTTVNGTPLSLVDFGLAGQLGDVAGVAGKLTLPEYFWYMVGVLGTCVLLLLVLQPLMKVTGRTRFLTATLSLALLVAVFTPSFAAEIGKTFSVDVYARMPAANNNRTYGLTIALWRDSVLQSTTRPENYSEEYMQEVLARIDALLAEEGSATEEDERVKPNVIMVLSEAFFDTNRLPGLTYERDPLENFHALEKEGISGTFFSHYLGYGTGYIEMAMQYGVSNQDFGPSTNVCFMEDEAYEHFDALAEQFQKDDYRAEMLHAYDDSLYNRTVTYPMLGYDALHFSSDIQDMGIVWGGSPYGGYYLRDAYTIRGILKRMREINADEEKQAFLYAITMENHQPFDAEKFEGKYQIDLNAEGLSEEDTEIARVMVEGVVRADQALGELANALKNSSVPTVLVYFGDHRPNLFMSDGETVYTKFGLSPSNEVTEWTAEQVAELYSTDYLIWSNDAALMEGLAGTERDSSVTAIGPQLLELIGQPVSRYWGLQGMVSREILTNEEQYFVDAESRVYRSAEEAELTERQLELLELRTAVLYDAFYGKQHITAAMNELAGT